MTIASVLTNPQKARYIDVPNYAAQLVDSFIATMADFPTTYTHVAFAEESAAITAGATEYINGWAGYWYDKDGEGEWIFDVDPDIVQAKIDADAGGTGFIMADIEAWTLDLAGRAEGIPQLLKACVPWHEADKRPFGFYSLMPYPVTAYGQSLYDAVDASDPAALAIITSTINTWMQLQDLNYADLGAYVDCLCPRCYKLSAAVSMDDWKWQTGLIVAEAVRIANGKPVYPVMWFRYTDNSGENEMSEAEFIAAIQFLAAFPGTNGVLFWEGGDAPTGFTYTDVITDLVNGTGDFIDS